MVLPGLSGVLTLEAINPGPHEILRASIDYDGISSSDFARFNLVLHRLASHNQPIVEQQEVYRGVSVDVADADYIGHALAESALVRIDGRIPDQRPSVTFRLGIEVESSYVYVDSAWSDASCLSDYDLIGSNTESTGLFALDQVSSIDLVVIVPDAQDLGPVALFTAERYCRRRHAMLLIDPPTHWREIDDVIRAARESGFASPNVTTYFPRPVDQVPAGVLGAIAGALSAGDACEGIWGLPSGAPLQMRGQVHLPFALCPGEQAALRRAGVSSLRSIDRTHFELTGRVTLNSGSACSTVWNELRHRRTALFIIDSIERGTRWAAFQKRDPETWVEVRDQVQGFLHDLFFAGALSGTNATSAGYIVQEQLESEAERKPGISFVIGFALPGQVLQRFRFRQCPVECEVQQLRVECPVALAS